MGAIRERTKGWRADPALLAASGLVLLVVGCHLWVNPSNPPGFYRDEAAISTNALAIAETGRDQYGAWMPLYFRSFDDYKSPEFVYLLAAVFRVTGPSQEVARGLAAVLVLGCIAGLALLATRQSGSRRVGLAMFVLAGSTAWLYEVGRLAFEVALLPLAVVLLLLVVERCRRMGSWTLGGAVLVGLILGAIAYSYAAGRLYAPLLALCVPLASGLRRTRFVLAAWGSFALTLLPLGVYMLRHPGALTSRFDDLSFVQPGMSAPNIARQGVENYLGYLNFLHWARSGDPNDHHHVVGAGSLSIVVVLLAGASLVILVRRSQLDGFWRFALAATLLGPVPAAATVSHFHTLRSMPLVVGLLAFATPALAALDRALRERRRWAVPIALVLSVVWLGGLAQFGHAFLANGPGRQSFDASVPVLLDRGIAAHEPFFSAPGDLVALTHARWYEDVHNLPRERIEPLPTGALPPRGALVFGSTDECTFACAYVDRNPDFWLARAS